MPQLSIIIPVYNKEDFIDSCIQSVLQQSFTDFELILVDDGSTDQSGVRCMYYQEADERVVYIRQENAGVSAARNAGLQIAKGSFIGFIDSDDTIETDMYETLMANLIANEADISACRMTVIFPDHKTLTPLETGVVLYFNHDEALAECLRGGLERSANNKIYKTEILKGLSFEGKIYEDILFSCKAFLNSGKTVLQQTSKYNYMVRENSVSMSSFNENYIETIDVSAQIKELVLQKNEKCLEEAKEFDVTANISLLNLLLVTGKEKYEVAYSRVVNNLRSYSTFIKNSPLVRKKHKYAFLLFTASPKVYTLMMQWYCKLTNAEVTKRAP